ncbi:hypothetical protein UFOVP276_161 [uncultured Caudovirales phage]|uniref:Uncharacterized protein n=1 Tax=uncultured Caudovirales phage TaxID=2100421 RepID=A0A6J5LAX4_9CAUD|nr:hypothetical protein UFOVP127_55 [uncultured Caudovirales phage]CAB4135205.1 hypothetical protein UFOVP276_161 [uncultured Caudovirales phage]
MSGLGITTLLQLATAQVELPDSIDGIVEKVREILTKGNVRSISIRDGEPITYQRMASPAEVALDPLEEWSSDITLGDMYRNVDMEEFDLKEQGLVGASPQTVLFWAIYYIEHENMSPTHILVSKDSDLWSWIGLSRRQGRKLDRFMGLKIERAETIPTSAVILFGSNYPGAGVGDVRFALKVTAEVPNAQVNRKAISSGSDSNASSRPAEVVE